MKTAFVLLTVCLMVNNTQAEMKFQEIRPEQIVDIILNAPASMFTYQSIGDNGRDFFVRYADEESSYTIAFNWEDKGLTVVRCCAESDEFAKNSTTSVFDSNMDGVVDCVMMGADVLQAESSKCYKKTPDIMKYGQMILDSATLFVLRNIGHPVRKPACDKRRRPFEWCVGIYMLPS